jgi:transposase-like protein
VTTVDSRRAAAIAAYRAGATTREIAAQCDVHPVTIGRWVAQVDALRRTGPRGRLDVADSLIVELHDVEHLSFAATAAEVKMSKSGVINRYRTATEGKRRDRR